MNLHLFRALSAHLITTQWAVGSQLTIMATLVASMWRSTLCTHQGSDLTASALSLPWEDTTDAGLLMRSVTRWGTDPISSMDPQCPGTNGGHSTMVEWKHPWGVCPFSHAPDLCPGHRPHHRGGPIHLCHPTLPHRHDRHLPASTGFQGGWGTTLSMLIHPSTAWGDPSAHRRWNTECVCVCVCSNIQ